MYGHAPRPDMSHRGVVVHQVMIPSRVRHPCVMAVEAVFADRVHAYVTCWRVCAKQHGDHVRVNDGTDTFKCHGAAAEAWHDGWQSLHPHTLCR